MKTLKFTVLEAAKKHVGNQMTLFFHAPPRRIVHTMIGTDYALGLGWVDYNGHQWGVTVTEYPKHTFMLLQRRGNTGRTVRVIFKRVKLETSMWDVAE